MCIRDRYPEYIFLQTQPQIYEYMKEDFPEIFEKIKERVKEGRWEADGAVSYTHLYFRKAFGFFGRRAV